MEKPSTERTSGNSDSKSEIHLGEASREAWRGEDDESAASMTHGGEEELLKTFFPATSTSKRWWSKKSAPRIGTETGAR